MTNNSDKKIAQTEAEYAQKIVQQYRNIISETPLLLSLLYDADLLPEQIRTVRNAISMSSVVIAYKEGKNATSAALTQSRAETAAAYERAARICEDRNDEIWDRNTGEKVGLDGAAEKIRALTPSDAIAARDRMIADSEARGMQRAADIAKLVAGGCM